MHISKMFHNIAELKEKEQILREQMREAKRERKEVRREFIYTSALAFAKHMERGNIPDYTQGWAYSFDDRNLDAAKAFTKHVHRVAYTSDEHKKAYFAFLEAQNNLMEIFAKDAAKDPEGFARLMADTAELKNLSPRKF